MARLTEAASTKLEPYLRHLRTLPFVTSVRPATSKNADPSADVTLQVSTPGGKRSVHVEWKKSHLSREMVEYAIATLARVKSDVLLFAPYVGRTTGDRLSEAGIGYVDLAGNCHVEWGKGYVAHIEGRKLSERAPQARAVRVPSLLVLFSLLARPSYVGVSTRQLALAAGGVSPQTATDLRKRLVAEGCIIPNGRDHFWAPNGKERALDLLVAGYEQLAAHLRVGRFRARPGPIEEVENLIERNLEQGPTWTWGGGAALHRRSRLYRGTRTIVYVDGPLPARLPGLIPDPNGEVIFARPPGQCANDKDGQALLIYLDLQSEGEPRAFEVAQGLRTSLFEETHE
jgi:hypothetical protein